MVLTESTKIKEKKLKNVNNSMKYRSNDDDDEKFQKGVFNACVRVIGSCRG